MHVGNINRYYYSRVNKSLIVVYILRIYGNAVPRRSGALGRSGVVHWQALAVHTPLVHLAREVAAPLNGATDEQGRQAVGGVVATEVADRYERALVDGVRGTAKLGQHKWMAPKRITCRITICCSLQALLQQSAVIKSTHENQPV